MQGEWCTSGHNKRQYNLALNTLHRRKGPKKCTVCGSSLRVLPWHNIDHPASRSTRATGWYQEQILVGDPSITPTEMGALGIPQVFVFVYVTPFPPPPFRMSFTCVPEAYGSFRKWKPDYKSCGLGSIISEKSVHLQSISDFQNCPPAFCL